MIPRIRILTADGGLYDVANEFCVIYIDNKRKWCSNKENFTFEEALRAVRVM